MWSGVRKLTVMVALAVAAAGQQASVVIESDIPEGGGYLASGSALPPTKYGARVEFAGKPGLHRVVFRSLVPERREPRSFELQLEADDRVVVAPEWRSNRWDPNVIAWGKAIAPKRLAHVFEVDGGYRISGLYSTRQTCGIRSDPEGLTKHPSPSPGVIGFGVRWRSDENHERIECAANGMTHVERIDGVDREIGAVSIGMVDGIVEVDVQRAATRVFLNHVLVSEVRREPTSTTSDGVVVFGQPGRDLVDGHWILRRSLDGETLRLDSSGAEAIKNQGASSSLTNTGDWWVAAPGAAGQLRLGSPLLRDYRLTVDVVAALRETSGRSLALRVRSRSEGDHYEFWWAHDGQWQLRRRVGGQEAVLQSGKTPHRAFDSRTDRRVALEASGFGVAAYIRGERVASLLDGSNEFGAAEVHLRGTTIHRPRLVPVPTEAPVTVVIQRGDALLVQRRGVVTGGDTLPLLAVSPRSLELPAELLALDPLVSECLRDVMALRARSRTATGGLGLPHDAALLGRAVYFQTRTIAAGDGTPLNASRVLRLRLR